MTGPFHAAARLAAVILVLSLGGCLAAPVVLAIGGALVTAADAYCGAVTDTAKQALRDRVTAGRALVACPAEGR